VKLTNHAKSKIAPYAALRLATTSTVYCAPGAVSASCRPPIRSSRHRGCHQATPHACNARQALPPLGKIAKPTVRRVA